MLMLLRRVSRPISYLSSGILVSYLERLPIGPRFFVLVHRPNLNIGIPDSHVILVYCSVVFYFYFGVNESVVRN
jgi:hypothetical protein